MKPLKPIATIPGLDKEPERALREALNALTEQVNQLGKTSRVTSLKTANYAATEGEVVRIRAGLTLTLPRARPENQGAEIAAMVETEGTLRVVSVAGTINYQAFVNVGTRRLVVFKSNGAGNWASSEDAGADASITTTIISSGAGGHDATYHLEVADAALPSARVAASSTEVALDYSILGAVSWFLNTASVVFAKLQDLTGLSVLGRAANSSGVMAAITAAAGDRYLRSNTGNTSLEFGNPASTSIINTAGTFQVAAYTGAISKAQNATATLFSGILDDGVATTDRQNLNFVNSASTNAVLVDNAGTNSTEIAFPVATDAITNALMANMAQSRIKGRAEGAGTGDPTDLTPTQVVAIIDAESPTWTGSHTFTGVNFTVTTTGDVLLDSDTAATLSAPSVAVQGTAVMQITGAANVDIDATDDVNIDADTISLSTNEFVYIDGPEAFLKFLEEDIGTIVTVGAGNGMYWVQNLVPSQPIFTDDVEASWILGYACPTTPLTANAAATNAVTNLTIETFTVPANTARVGTLYRFTGWFQFLHTAALTPTLTIELLLDGGVIETFIVSPIATAATWNGKVEAMVCFRSIGAGGTIKSDVQCTTSVGVNQANCAFGSTSTGTDAIDTTADRVLLLRIRMTTAVASNTLTVVQGFIERLK